MYSREIVILANSRKHKGKCIAGIDLNRHVWVRPVNNFRGGVRDPTAFYEDDFLRYYNDPLGPCLLDCVTMNFSAKKPRDFQPENEVISPTPWERSTKVTVEALEKLAEDEECEWLADDCYHVDRITRDELDRNPISSSLALLHLCKKENHAKTYLKFQKPNRPFQTRIMFDYQGKHFDLSLTDETYSHSVNKYPHQEHLNDFYLTVGLGEYFKATDAYHKLAVGLIPVSGE